MEDKYHDALERINTLRDYLTLLFDKLDPNSNEEKRVYAVIEGLIDKLDMTGTALDQFINNPRYGGFLKKKNGVYEMFGKAIEADSYLEAWNDTDKKWESGKVSVQDGEYYFYNLNMGNSQLYEGMRARVKD